MKYHKAVLLGFIAVIGGVQQLDDQALYLFISQLKVLTTSHLHGKREGELYCANPAHALVEHWNQQSRRSRH